ncbi:hypothetical protein BOTBODRAFT_53330 [Botryobasidium botryosum FD-172 SS1]|uniref:Thioester reductase (TE) domain-containing protein n=1 Tax=Botryobasidium botryosum (strain FD-172 SS1) TaxID=930990 RepID=A0A067MZ10_BOTB1|nr:hypothetical protein BOTBODRAFT_53330 [Botryobasidium botryosum FD-172 SS1]
MSARAKELDDLVAKYTANPFPIHSPTLSDTASPSDSEVVLITGTTGGLGGAALAYMVARPLYTHIYAFNRKDRRGRDLKERQVAALVEHGVDPSIVDSPKITFLEGDTTLANLGLSETTFAEIRDSVTLIIPNAWKINLLSDVSSFEPLILGVRNLIDFALGSPRHTPPRILFPGSVFTFVQWPFAMPVPELPIVESRLAVGMGYGESKWVAERILHIASEKTPLRTTSIRIGQLVGGDNGSWDTDQWFPAAVRGGEITGLAPHLNGHISLLSFPAAAAAMMEMRNSPYPTLHLRHPRPLLGVQLAQHCADAVGAKVVPIPDWLAALERHLAAAEESDDFEAAMADNPTLPLIGLMRMMVGLMGSPGKDAVGFPIFDMTRALEVAPSLGEDRLPRVGAAMMDKWLEYWRHTGFLKSKPAKRFVVARL